MTDFISNNLIINVMPDGKCHIDIVKSAEIQLKLVFSFLCHND